MFLIQENAWTGNFKECFQRAGSIKCDICKLLLSKGTNLSCKEKRCKHLRLIQWRAFQIWKICSKKAFSWVSHFWIQIQKSTIKLMKMTESNGCCSTATSKTICSKSTGRIKHLPGLGFQQAKREHCLLFLLYFGTR